MSSLFRFIESRRRAGALPTFLFIAAVISGCQTPRHREFERVHEGMDKGQVLDAVGNPTRTLRQAEIDRWIYVFYPSEQTTETKEIHFRKGVVIYKGAPFSPVPSIPAEEQDARNEESNQAAERARAAERAAAEQLLKEANEPDPKAEEYKVAPKFESVD
jgi:outer membrane protein assembly factor BamE (lipoprotein component of BamABCDE complex)